MTRTIVVLGGGGMKGLAHIGAWQALREANVEVAEIVGTSIGALVGAMICGGVEWKELVPRALALRKEDVAVINRWVALFNGIRQVSTFKEAPFRKYLRRELPVERFEDLGLPLGVNAVDLETGEMLWFGAGGSKDVALADAVYASCALPLFYPPAAIDERYLVDGGIRDTLPIERAAERGADRIIAVDVGAGESGDPADTISRGLVALHHRVYDIMSYSRRQLKLKNWDGPPLVYVRPELEGYSAFDFSATEYFLEEGYRATREALIAAGVELPDQKSGAEERPA